ncbi:MAG: hypothetical protein ORN28_11620 [Rhodoferax sp.]|nr:hypothetical protein [Rhodoferax sp.]
MNNQNFAPPELMNPIEIDSRWKDLALLKNGWLDELQKGKA